MATKSWVGTDSGNEGDWDTAANWSPSGVPGSATTDDIYFENSSQDVTAGLDQTAMGAMSSLNIDQSYTGSLGTDSVALQIESPIVAIGYHNGPGTPVGSPLLHLDMGSVTATAITVSNAGTSADSTRAPIRLLAANAASTLVVLKGKVSVATAADETAIFGTITAAYDTRVSTDVDLFIGSGTAITTLNILGGDTFLEKEDATDMTTCTVRAGTLTTSGTGTIGILNVSGGVVTCSHADQVGGDTTSSVENLNVYGGDGTVDFSRSLTARTVDTMKLDPGGFITFDANIVTVTDNIDPYTSGINVTFTAS